MAIVAATQPHPIYLAGRWVDSPDVLVIDNPADAGRRPPARPTTRPRRSTRRRSRRPSPPSRSPATCPPTSAAAILREISAGIKARREELGRLIALEAGKPIRDALVEVDRAVADLPPRRRGGGADDRRGHPARPDAVVEGPHRHHPALPDRPDRGHQPVQLPAQPGRPQDRAGHRLGQPDRPQAAVQGPAHDADGRRDHRGGRRAGGLGLHPADDPRAGRPDGRGPALQAADLHRLAVGRLADEGPGGQEEGRARARRQRRRHRRQDRRPRLGGQALPRRRLRLRRPGLHQRPARVHPRGRLGRLPRAVRGRAPRRSRSATRSIRRRTSARWSTRPRPAGPSAGSTRRSRWAARCSPAARPTARSSRRRS